MAHAEYGIPGVNDRLALVNDVNKRLANGVIDAHIQRAFTEQQVERAKLDRLNARVPYFGAVPADLKADVEVAKMRTEQASFMVSAKLREKVELISHKRALTPLFSQVRSIIVMDVLDATNCVAFTPYPQTLTLSLPLTLTLTTTISLLSLSILHTCVRAYRWPSTTCVTCG